MGGMHLCFFAAAAVFVAVQGYDIQSVLEKIPEGQRLGFLRHHIQKGYELSNVDKGNLDIMEEQKLNNVPEEFSVALYKMAIENHQIDNDDLLGFLRVIVCFPNGQCIDIGDVGVHPKLRKN